MKLKLKSDFTDVYDSWFDLDGEEFRRVTADGLNREEMFKFFSSLGIKTPLYGYFDDFLERKYDENAKVVIYYDKNAHFGEGKIIKPLKDLNSFEKTCFLSEYIKFPELALNVFLSCSTRLLFIGNLTFRYTYMSKDDWRSNCGETFCTKPVKTSTPKYRKNLCLPFCSIDFVGQLEDLRAIDLNCAPGIRGLDFSNYLTNEDIVRNIKRWIEENG